MVTMRTFRKAFNLLSRSLGEFRRSKFNFSAAVGDGLGSAVMVAPARWVSRQFTEAPIVVEDNEGEQFRDHALAQLWRRPNPWYGGGTLRSAIGFDYTFHGNAYVEKDRGNGRAVIGLVYQPSWQVHPKGSTTELITHYEIATGTGTREVARDDMIHFRDGIDPHDQRVGISPLQSLLREIYTDDEAANMTASILRNLGVPGVVISPTSPDDAIEEPVAKRITSYFKRMFSGDQAGNALVIGRSVKIDTLDIDLAKLNIDKLRQIPEERVCAVIGVPAAVVGFGSGLEQTKVGATMKELREMAYENVIIPMQRMSSEELDRSLLPEFETDPKWSVQFDNSSVRVLQEDSNRRSERIMNEYKGGGITRTELRTDLGREVTPADEVFRMGFSDVLIPRNEGAVTAEKERQISPWLQKAIDDGDKEAIDFAAALGGVPVPEWIVKAFKGPAADRSRLIEAFEADRLRLAAAWAADLVAEFNALGRAMAAAWLEAEPTEELASRNGQRKQIPDASDRAIIDQILMGMQPGGLGYEEEYLNILHATHSTIETVMNLGVNLTDPMERAIVASGGTRRGLIDLTEQTRTSMYRTVASARENGLGVKAIAREIRDQIPRGPWLSVKTRSEIIARTEAKFAQNESSLTVYKNAANVSRVQAFDAQLGETDADCENRNGQIMTIEAAGMIEEHPNGTLSWAPVVDERVEA